MKAREHFLHGAYWITSILFLCLGLFAVESSYYSFLIAVIYAVYGFLLFILFYLKKKINKLGLRVHYALTTIGGLLVCIFIYLSVQSNLTGYTESIVVHNDGSLYEAYANYSWLIGKLILFLLLIQLLFLSSFIRSIFRKK